MFLIEYPISDMEEKVSQSCRLFLVFPLFSPLYKDMNTYVGFKKTLFTLMCQRGGIYTNTHPQLDCCVLDWTSEH